MFEQSLKLLLRIPKLFDAIQVLKWFSFLPKVTCIILHACLKLKSGIQRSARAFESQKNSSRGTREHRKTPKHSVIYFFILNHVFFFFLLTQSM